MSVIREVQILFRDKWKVGDVRLIDDSWGWLYLEVLYRRSNWYWGDIKTDLYVYGYGFGFVMVPVCGWVSQLSSVNVGSVIVKVMISLLGDVSWNQHEE